MPMRSQQRILGGITSGLLAGAAGATVLNIVSYTKQAIDGTASSATPDQAAQAVAHAVGVEISGSPDTRQNRLEGLGPLSGYGVGMGVGALAGALRAVGMTLPSGIATLAIGLGAMAISDGIMTAVGITDPRTWTPTSVATDALPHLAYGAATALALQRMVDRPH